MGDGCGGVGRGDETDDDDGETTADCSDDDALCGVMAGKGDAGRVDKDASALTDDKGDGDNIESGTADTCMFPTGHWIRLPPMAADRA